jgi:Family of unknown function (DUF6272)
MEPRIAHPIYMALRGDRSVFLYSGAFHDEHTGRLIALGEAAAEGGDGRGAARGRLAFIMVEAYQNILRHRAVLPPQVERGEGRSLFLLRCGEDGQQVVVAVNPVKKSDVTGLRTALHKLHGMDPSQLKNLFLSGLQHTSDQPRRGAGLGLIEMARRSGSDLGYTLRGLGPDHELFILAVRLGSDRAYDGVLTEAAVLHGTVVQHDVLLLHIGTRPVPVQEAVLRMLEEDVDTSGGRSDLRGRAYLAANGFLSSVREGGERYFCALTRDGAHYSLAVGRSMPRAAAETLLRHVRGLERSDRSELDRRYRNAILKRGGEEDDPDLLDLARVAVEPVQAETFPINDGEVLALVRVIF